MSRKHKTVLRLNGKRVDNERLEGVVLAGATRAFLYLEEGVHELGAVVACHADLVLVQHRGFAAAAVEIHVGIGQHGHTGVGAAGTLAVSESDSVVGQAIIDDNIVGMFSEETVLLVRNCGKKF